MRTIAVFLCVLLTGSVFAAEDKAQTPKEVARAYFEALTSGDLEAASALVDAPYSFDRTKVIATKAEVEAAHKEIVGNKGKRAIPEYTIEATTEAEALDPKQFPACLVFRVAIAVKKDRKEHVDIYVSKAKPHKVLGFSD
jgi:ketosteroid isomerase-like protein